jgi:hypothetical protein
VDFAARARFWLSRAGLYLAPSGAPAVGVCPYRVARSVLYCMWALNPSLRITYPEFTDELISGGRAESFPDKIALRLALTVDARVKATGVNFSFSVTGVHHSVLAEVCFSPFVWALALKGADQLTEIQSWADASDWHLYDPHRATVDLRNLYRLIPVIDHPQAHPLRSDWPVVTSSAAGDIIFGETC